MRRKAFLFNLGILAASVGAALAGEPVTRPNIIDFSARIDALEAKLKTQCKTLVRRPIQPPFLETVVNKQEQLDCDGFTFVGKSRRAEFMFADGLLEGVWIMTEADEESRFLEDFTALYGEPQYSFRDNIAFPQANALIRRDITEILYYSERMAPYYLEWFEQGAGE